MKTQKIYQIKLIGLMLMILVLVGSFSIKQEALSYGDYDYSNSGGSYSSCSSPFKACNPFESIINYSLSTFYMLILWMVSPVGIIFFWSSISLISKRTSKIKRGLAWIGQVFALIVWLSFMLLLLVAYLDSVTINAFGLGGKILDTVIASGMVFFVVMFVFALYEKSVEYGMDRGGGREGGNKIKPEIEKDRGKNENEKKGPEGIKTAGIRLIGLKDRIRRKIKDELKEIVDDEIERRL